MTPSIVAIALLLQATPEVVSAKDDPRECKLALDAKGQPRLAWTSGPEVIVKELTVATRGPKDKGWTPQTIGTCGVRCNTALSIDKKGLLRVSFTSTCEGAPPSNKCVRVAEVGPKKIAMLTTPSTLNGGFSTTHLLGADGTLHLAFGAHDEKTFAYGTFVKGVWTRGPTPPVDGTEFDSKITLALDKSGIPTALYDDRGRKVTSVRWQDGKVVSELVALEGPGRDSHFVRGPDDVPHGVFTLNESQIAHATRGESGWTVEVVTKVEAGAAVDATIAVARDGALHVAWYEPAAGALRYATRAAAGGSEWKVTTLDGTRAKQAGLQPSLAVDAKGVAHLCYQALAEKSVKYLRLEPK